MPITPSFRVLTIRNRIGGVLTDFDTLPVLRDPSQVYGVIRSDGGIVLAADGINNIFTRDDVGIYHFTISDLTPGITYTAWVETVTDGAIERNSTTWTAGVAEAVGYYATRALMLNTAGQEQFDAEMRLDPDALVADEDVVQLALDNADSMVDQIAFELGATFAADPHAFLTTDQPLFRGLQMWASRWARADGHLLRGEPATREQGNDMPEIPATDPARGGGPEGLFTGMKREAERRIRALINAKINDASGALNQGGDLIGVSTVCPMRAQLRNGVPSDANLFG